MLNLKKALLGTSAIVAVGLVLGSASAAHANAVTYNLSTAGDTWASTGLFDHSTGDITSAAAGENVDIQGAYTLTIASDATAGDTASKVAFTLGDVTNTAGLGAIAVDATAGANATAINKVSITGAFTVDNTVGGVAVGATVGTTADVGTLAVNGSGVAAGTSAFTSVGAFTSTGTVDVTGGTAAGATAAATFSSTANMGGALTVTGGTNATATATATVTGNFTGTTVAVTGSTAAATLNLNGATAAATSYTLTDGATSAKLAFNRAGAQTVTGTIDGAGDGQGTLALTGAGVKTFASNIGATHDLLAVTVANTSTLDLATNNVSLAATNVTLAGATGTLNIGTGAVTGAIDGANDDEGIVNFTANNTTAGLIGAVHDLHEVNVTGGTLNVANNIAATDINISAGTMRPTAARSFTGDINLLGTGTLDLGTFALTETAAGSDLTVAGATSNLALTINDTTNGQVVLGGGAGAFVNGGTLTIAPTISNTVLHDGDIVNIVKGGAAATLGTTTIDPTALVSWTVSSAGAGVPADRYGVATAANDVIMTATVRNAASVAGVSSYNASSINALTSLDDATASSALRDLGSAVQGLATGADVDKAGAQLRPETNGAIEAASFGAVGQVLDLVSARNDYVRLAQAGGVSGISAGEARRGAGLWAQGFGKLGRQDRRESIDGYDADTYGAAAGVDFQVMANARVGVAFAYANTDVDDKGTRSGSGEKVDSYVGSIYGSYTGSPWYVDGSLSYGLHDYDSTRLVNFSGVTPTIAKGSFDGNQFGAKGEFGYPVAVKKMTLTPFVSLDYNYLDLDGYTETGAGAANLTVNGSDTYSLKSGLGAKMAASLGEAKGWNFKPNARAVWTHEFNEDAPDITSTYASTGGTSFVSQGVKLATDAAVLGVGMDIANSSIATFSVKYDAEIKEEYVGHSGMLQIRKQF